MLLVTGATGRMGGAILRHGPGPMRAGTRSIRPIQGADEVARFGAGDLLDRAKQERRPLSP